MISRMGRTDMSGSSGDSFTETPRITGGIRTCDLTIPFCLPRNRTFGVPVQSVYNTQLMPVRIEPQGDIAFVLVDNPPVNALSAGIPEALADAVATAVADPAVRAVVIMGAGRTFIAGADIAELE